MKRFIILTTLLTASLLALQNNTAYAQNTENILKMLGNIETRLNQLQTQQQGGSKSSVDNPVVQQSSMEPEINKALADSLTISIELIGAKLTEIEKAQQAGKDSVEITKLKIEALENRLNAIDEKNEQVSKNDNTSKLTDELVPELKTLVSELKKTITTAPKPVIAFKGDFRYRHDLIDEESLDRRDRERIRVRVGMTASVSENVSVEVQLASCATDDPISTNQDLGGAFSRKPVWIDKAYFAWKPQSVKGFTFSGGKVKNPFYTVNKTQLLWDSDITPEGLIFTYSRTVKTTELFFNGSGTWVEERKSANDSWLLGGQGGITVSNLPVTITTGAGYYLFTEAKGNATFYNTQKSFGNSVDSKGKYATGFKELEGFLEVGGAVKGLPIVLYGNIVNNLDADEDNLGYLTGVGFGKCKNKGSWALSYDYRYLEKDALLAVFTESDFNGGGTDGKGHKLTLGYQLNKNIQPEVSYCLSTRGLEHGKEFDKLTVDFNYKF